MPKVSSRRSTLPVLLVVAAVVLVVAAGGSYAVTSTMLASPGPRWCSPMLASRSCIPTLRATTIIGPLRSNDWDCTEQIYDSQTAYWSCGLTIGQNEYRVDITAFSESVRGYSVDVLFAPGADLTDQARSLLLWFAIIPFAGDKAPASVASSWVARGISEKANRRTTIYGYDYALNAARPRGIELVLDCDP
jgi:hypothetical protein